MSNGTPPPRRVPFALVDLVTPESPAASAGLLVDDKIVAFGGVSLRSFATPRLALGALPELLQGHENMELEVIIERSEAESVQIMTMKLTPRRWQGQGLLGCHVVPMSVSQTDSRYQPEVATAALARSMSSHV